MEENKKMIEEIKKEIRNLKLEILEKEDELDKLLETLNINSSIDDTNL